MTLYKLIYFNIRARGELARWIFAYTSQKYEDFRVDYSDWPEMKPTTPVGTLPILEITEGGKETKISQSRAICRFLANKFNIAGKTDLEKAKADEIIDQINDEIDQFARLVPETDPDRKQKEFERLLKDVVPFNLKYFENVLAENKSGYLVGNCYNNYKSFIDAYNYTVE